jgi:nucleoside-diphosphate-sugar epimerase
MNEATMSEHPSSPSTPSGAFLTLDAPDVTVITGAGGWLGTGLVAALTSETGSFGRPGRLRLFVHHSDPVPQVDDRIEIITGDITVRADLDKLFDGLVGTVDVVHTAGVIHPTEFAEFDQVNHLGTDNVLRAAERAGIRRMVHVSSNSPFGTNPSRSDTFRNDEPYHPYLGYGSSKMAAELCVLQAAERGLDVVMVRPPWFYGPHQPARQTTFFTLVRTGRFPVLGDGGQRRSMAFIDNLVQGIVRAELTPTDAGLGWWIADARAYTVREIVETVGRALTDEGFDVKPNRFRLPEIAGTVAERIDRTLQKSGRYNQQFHVLGEMNKTIAVDISAARRDLGYEPEVELYDGMRRSIRWCLDQGIQL